MPKIVLRDVVVVIDGVDLSDHASSVTINSSKDLVDGTSFGAQYKQNLIGLGDASIDVTFFQDYDAASVDATLWPLHDTGETFHVELKPASVAVSESNPRYEMAEAILPAFTPLNGKVGDASTIDVTFQNSGQDGVTRHGSGS